jgi:hypothetical protein
MTKHYKLTLATLALLLPAFFSCRVLEQSGMSCEEMMELEASCHRFAERRHVTIQPDSERRNQPTGTSRVLRRMINVLAALETAGSIGKLSV